MEKFYFETSYRSKRQKKIIIFKKKVLYLGSLICVYSHKTNEKSCKSMVAGVIYKRKIVKLSFQKSPIICYRTYTCFIVVNQKIWQQKGN